MSVGSLRTFLPNRSPPDRPRSLLCCPGFSTPLTHRGASAPGGICSQSPSRTTQTATVQSTLSSTVPPGRRRL